MDRSFITALIRDHRAIESALDGLAEAVPSAAMDAGAVRQLAELIARHYTAEERFLEALEVCDARLAAKLRAQHDEASEIATWLLKSLEVGNPAEAIYLSRRLLAIARHNMIEEERDVFPLAGRIP